jgi:hypothetical protein
VQQEASRAAQTPAPTAGVQFGVVETPPARRTRGPNKAKETMVGPGPIPAGTFQVPQSKLGAQNNGFIGGGTPTPAATPAGFGMAPASAAGADIESKLAKAFNMPLGG